MDVAASYVATTCSGQFAAVSSGHVGRHGTALGRPCAGKEMVQMRLLSQVMVAAVNVACIVHACFSPRPACSEYTHCRQCLSWLHLKSLGMKWLTRKVIHWLETMSERALEGVAPPWIAQMCGQT